MTINWVLGGICVMVLCVGLFHIRHGLSRTQHDSLRRW
jgi:hypothetical protein